MRRRQDKRAGFTLLEVMIAVAILAIGMTAIFSSEGQAIRVGQRATQFNIATTLARCKMGELEELIAEEGAPITELTGSDGCCEDAEFEGYSCDWSIAPIELTQDVSEQNFLEEQQDALSGDENAQTAAIDSALGGGTDGFTEMAVSMAFPILQPSIEAQVRRVTIEINFGRGGADGRSFAVSRFVVLPASAVQIPETEEDPSLDEET